MKKNLSACRKVRVLPFILTISLLLCVCAGCGGNEISFENGDVTLPDPSVTAVSETDDADAFTADAAPTNEDAANPENTSFAPETEGLKQTPPTEEQTDETAASADTTETETAEDAEEQEYVVNTNSGKFHYPDCDSVKDIKSTNRSDRVCSRDTLIGEGYVPCKRCNP